MVEQLICEPLGAPLSKAHSLSYSLKRMVYLRGWHRRLGLVRSAPVWPSPSRYQPLSPGIASRQWHTSEGCHLFRGGCDAPLHSRLSRARVVSPGGTLLVPKWNAPSSQRLPFKQGFWHLLTDDWLHLIVRGNFMILFVVLSFINFTTQTHRASLVWKRWRKVFRDALLLYTTFFPSVHKQTDLKTLISEVSSPSRPRVRFYLRVYNRTRLQTYTIVHHSMGKKALRYPWYTK